MESNKPMRPLFILWNYSAKGPEGRDIVFKKRRNSAKYIALAEYLCDNPPNIKPFRPRDDLGVAAHSLQTYRRDVETWVAMRMMTAIIEDEEFGDEDIFPQIINELHELPWYRDSERKGFYYIQPMPKRIGVASREDSWAFEAIGARVPYMKAEGLIGFWYEPKFEQSEQWKTRLAVNNLRRTVERFAEAALTGRTIGKLTQAQHWYLVNAAVKSIQKALPPPEGQEQKEIPAKVDDKNAAKPESEEDG